MLILMQSSIVYFSTAIFLYILGNAANNRRVINKKYKHNISFWTWEILASLLIFAIISGIRWNVGVDHQHYLANYQAIQNNYVEISEYEPGFLLLTNLIAGAGLHYSFYFALLGFLQIFFVYYTFKNERYLLPFIGLIIILGSQYLMWMNGIRQMIAATIFLFSLHFAADRKYNHYIIFILLASLFHKSSIILLPIYFLAVRDFLPRRIFVLIIFVFSFAAGSNVSWISSVQSHLTPILSLLDYDNYSEIIDILAEKTENRVLGPRRVAEILLFIFIVLHSSKLRLYFSNTNFTIYYNIYIIGFILHTLLINAHHIFLRPIFFLTICSIPSASYLLVYLFRRSKRNIFVFTLILALATSYTPLSFIADFDKNTNEYSNFKFFWDFDS